MNNILNNKITYLKIFVSNFSYVHTTQTKKHNQKTKKED